MNCDKIILVRWAYNKWNVRIPLIDNLMFMSRWGERGKWHHWIVIVIVIV